ncbi:Signal transduction histidine kinase [Burkholderiales bacterium 8X]|nr:Signal transduction histidine kinase [Burkholderiales bacterium 8X]
MLPSSPDLLSSAAKRICQNARQQNMRAKSGTPYLQPVRRQRSDKFSMGLPGRLLLIASAAILPLALVSAIALQSLLAQQDEETRASTRGIVRALATAVDGELRLTIAALQTIALAESIAHVGDGGADDARNLMASMRASHPEWRAILLADVSGRILIGQEGRQELANVVERSSLEEVVRTGRPSIGPLAVGPGGALAFPVRVPVVRNDSVRYVLTAVVRPESITAVLNRQRVPEGWNVSVFDSNVARVARTANDEQLRGTPASPSLRELLAAGEEQREVIGHAKTLDGVRVLAAAVRTDFGGWTVVLGAPMATAELVLKRTLLAYGGGLFLSLGLGFLAAWWMSRSITRPMSSLRRGADALGRGDVPQTPSSGIPEVDAVAKALEGAALQRAQSLRERDALLTAEQAARSEAEAAQKRLNQLVKASTALAQSLEEESTLSAIARVVVPDLADICRIDLLDADGQLQRKLTHHFDRGRTAQIAQFINERPQPSSGPGSFPWAIATGEVFMTNLDDVDRLDDPELREFVERMALTAGCVVPLVARGRTIGVMAVLQAESRRRFADADVPMLVELAQRVALALDNVQLLVNAKIMQSRAESANRAKDEFLAMLGHELRNPLAPITLALKLMERRDDRAFPRERELIERQVKHLSRLVDDLLDVSRVVSGKITLRLERLDLREIVARALETCGPALQVRKQPPHVNMPGVPISVEGDPTRLTQVLSNLLNNSIKFTEPDGRIELTLRAHGDAAEVTVSDTGVGITAELLPRIFERFVQDEQPLQRAAGGLGLGLAIADSLVKLHRGSMQATSDGVGKGSTFTVRLPLADDLPHPLVPDEAPRAPKVNRQLRLLLVDDNLDALEVLAEWFRSEGHDIVIATQAREALDRLHEDSSIDAAILDVGLPEMDGYELARSLRADPRLKPIPLIALTGYGRGEDRAHALLAGFDDHFAKPAQVEALLERIQELVTGRESPG